jgi:hypothetical protein
LPQASLRGPENAPYEVASRLRGGRPTLCDSLRRLRKRSRARGTQRGWSERPCCAYATLGRGETWRRGCSSSGAGARPTDTRALALGAKAGARRPAFRAIRVLRPITTETRTRPKAGYPGAERASAFSRRAGAAWRPRVWSSELPTRLGRSVAKIIAGRIRESSGERFLGACAAVRRWGRCVLGRGPP